MFTNYTAVQDVTLAKYAYMARIRKACHVYPEGVTDWLGYCPVFRTGHGTLQKSSVATLEEAKEVARLAWCPLDKVEDSVQIYDMFRGWCVASLHHSGDWVTSAHSEAGFEKRLQANVNCFDLARQNLELMV